ncbi:MAG: hypothetical protein CO184_00460 [Candidatus Zambryskibacteria bacterium CG_4_9_14_3_um_filter_40_16]|uniref:3-deoxy-D-manno-octulosonate 8-phosphate phosphatase n=2 Tax=Candidatus Zambryskiibacteriota TaxID=1817925 RepID=A0A2H0K769_9BACT|nr:HAD-IIIA family hydrolase [Candidatus Parcubacteria bacterium]PIQ67085.1 MAG: hypothetical protein COV95_00605 [Candidatus Zambryskibacteria bacterium CG11_big_fil_rev_8_21_14_0_20_40_24]PJA34162.1 MAG: hypothetical protein CO184_00460 [Candidatus Zambryskibacteria bacterium CG_4_9_14_3_um_filter_40_16]
MKKLSWNKIKLLVLDFDGVMTDGFVYLNQDGVETVRCSRKDGLGIEFIQKIGIRVVVISREKNKVVEARCKKLKVPCFYGVANKKTLFESIVKKFKLSLHQTCYVGDDIIDIECVQIAGIGVVVGDAEPSVAKLSDYQTKRNGGDHAVREVCDCILLALKNKKSK